MTGNAFNQNSGETISSFDNAAAIDRRLFKAEIRAGAAHADALFRAGILTRLEAERIKNGLWTIAKRAEFDRHYFDSPPAADVFAFVEARLFQLINEGAAKFKTGRTRDAQAAVALRLWLRDEIEQIVELLGNLHEQLYSLKKKSDNKLFAAFLEMFERDDEMLREALKRANRMPFAAFDLSREDEALAEFDAAEIAHALDFAGVSADTPETISNRDCCVEFVGAAAFLMLHLSRLSNEFSAVFDLGDSREIFAAVRGKAARIYANQTALLQILQTAPLAADRIDLQEINAVVFESSETICAALEAMTKLLQKIDFPR